MKPGVANYIKDMNVISYGFDVDCIGKDNCKLRDDFLGYPDPRPYRTFANIRYALYEYWLRYYTDQSYILILGIYCVYLSNYLSNSLSIYLSN
jgi:hypothetical protein